MRRWWFVAFLLSSGCYSDGVVGSQSSVTLDVEGSYTIALRYGENGCKLESWVEGEELNGVVIDIVQDGSALTGTVEGITGGVLGLIHGSNVYEGSIEGSELTMTIYGRYPAASGNCTYTLDNELVGRVEGDFLEGTLAFTNATNGRSDCAALECASKIDFNGARTPEPQ